MNFEPLEIADERFLINRLIEQAPSATLIRELFKNAEENAALAPPGNRRIEIYPVEISGVRKLAFWNTGVGMDASELRRATDLSSSINKTMALDANFGIGAKVSGLSVSKAGIRYRSCKAGRVHQVTIGYDEDARTYGRFADQLPDGKTETIYDVTAVTCREGKPVHYDWTEVVLYGEADDHDTVSAPLGKSKKEERSFIATSIFRRFAEIAEGIEIRIDVAMTKGGGKNETGRTRTLRTFAEVVNSIPLKSQRVPDLNTGVAINYVHDPKHEGSAHTLSSRANPATGSTTFCALVHKGERYDYKTSKAWSAAAPNFGVPFGSRVLTVEIHIPDGMAMPTQYRDGLTWPEDRSPMTADYFSPIVRELMPEWVKDVIKAESPEASDNLDDLQADLQKLLDDFRVPTTTRMLSRKPESETSDEHFEGVDTAERITLPEEEIKPEAPDHPRYTEPDAIRRAKKSRIRKAPDGSQASISSKALERAPEIKILIDPDQIAEKEMKGRAARYYKEVQEIFVNGLYSAAERMAIDLERELAGEADPELIREVALKASRRFMAYRVGKSVCFGISKKLADDWTSADLDKATSPEALSMAADDHHQHLVAARKWAKDWLKQQALNRVS